MSGDDARHGSGFSAAALEPCGAAAAASATLEFEVLGLAGDGPAPRLSATVAGRTIRFTPDGNALSALRAATGGGALKFYCRIAPATSKGDLPDPDDLERLADLLTAAAAVRGAAAPDTAIPAAYTYLGQFIAHDLSDLKTLDGSAIELRSAALDLDSLFGAVPEDPLPEQAQLWKGGVGIGQARSFGPDVLYDDLPRRRDGRALIRDGRNDANLALAQLHLALSKFHQSVAQDAGRRSAAEARRITRRHVQSVVLHDFLARVIEPCTYRDIMENGRSVLHPGGLPKDRPFLIPIEFAAACFRVGHSMVRERYSAWNRNRYDAELLTLLTYTGQGGFFGDASHLPATWSVNWSAVLPGGPGTAPPANMARGIDVSLAERMRTLPARLFDGVSAAGGDPRSRSVGHATLSRQRTLGLPSGQQLLEAVNRSLDPAAWIAEVAPDTIAGILARGSSRPQDVRQFLRSTGFDTRTPLWLYCLVESQELRGGRCFGPLTSRVVMETIHAAIEAADDAIIADDGRTLTFGRDESLVGTETVRLPDIVALASTWPPRPTS